MIYDVTHFEHQPTIFHATYFGHSLRLIAMHQPQTSLHSQCECHTARPSTALFCERKKIAVFRPISGHH